MGDEWPMFYMPYIYDIGQSALLSFRPKPGLNQRTWVPKANKLPLDHRSRLPLLLVLIVTTGFQICNFTNLHKQWRQRMLANILK